MSILTVACGGVRLRITQAPWPLTNVSHAPHSGRYDTYRTHIGRFKQASSREAAHPSAAELRGAQLVLLAGVVERLQLLRDRTQLPHGQVDLCERLEQPEPAGGRRALLSGTVAQRL
jgi:hypothetical protein